MGDADQAAPASAPTAPARTAQRSNSEEAGCPRVKITRRPPRRRLYTVTSSPTPPCRTTSSMSSSCSYFKSWADDDLFYLPTEVAVSRGGLRKNCNDIAKKINIIYTSLFYIFILFSLYTIRNKVKDS